jgi:rRNA small subunit pseudouridine methyltransferase Nep1
VQLLRSLSVAAKGNGAKLLKVIKNPISDHLPTGCIKIATSYGAVKTVRLREYLPVAAPSGPVAVFVGAIAHGAIDTSDADEVIGVSHYAMSAAGVCGKLTDACEELWGVH